MEGSELILAAAKHKTIAEVTSLLDHADAA